MSVEGFNYDSPFMRLLNRVGDAFVLSLTFTLFCIPIVTIGPAITALYYTAMKGITVGEGYVFKNFWKSFKENIKQGIVMWLGFLVVFAVLGVDVWFWFMQIKAGGTTVIKFFAVVSVIMLAVAVMIFTYAFPLQAKFDNKIKVTVRNAFLLSIKYFPVTLLMILITAIVAWIFYYQTALAIIGFILVGFGIVGYIDAALMLHCFKPYLANDTNAGDPDEWHVDLPDAEDADEDTDSESDDAAETEE